MAESRSRLGQRIERLLDDRRSPRPERPHRWFSPAATGLVGLVVAAVPGITSGASPAGEPAPPAPAKEEAPAPVAELLERFELDEAIEWFEVPEVAPLLTELPTTTFELESPATLFRLQKELLDESLVALEAELAITRHELETLGLSDDFAELLEPIDHRVRTLRAQGERVDELLRELSAAFETMNDDVEEGAVHDIHFEPAHEDPFPFPYFGERR
jgi:hypothetical protein